MKLSEYTAQSLSKAANSDSRIFVIDGDLADSDGAHYFATQHPSRFVMAGIGEQNLVSVAAGMAAVGLKPYVFSFAAFLCFRAYDQIRVCLSQAKQPVTLIASHGTGLAGRNGKTHASLNDLALMLSLPEMEVWSPADFSDVDFLLKSPHTSPRYVRMSRCDLGVKQQFPNPASEIRWLLPKQPISIIAHGLATQWALEAAKLTARRGLSIGVLHVAKLKPLPRLEEVLRGIRHLIVIEDHQESFGFSTIIRKTSALPDVSVIGWPETFAGKSGDDQDLLRLYGLSGEQIAKRLLTQFSGASDCKLPI